MAKKKASSSTTSSASSWWKERSKIMASASKTVAKTAKPKAKKKVKAKKAGKAKKGEIYYCDVCGCEVVCVEPGAGEIICCEEPMCLVC
jgi:desulfoferrodoxin-like iron-binding protein